MRSLLRIFSFGLVCLLLIASSDAAVNRYGYRSGRSLAATQSGSVITVSPGAYQTPDPGRGGEAVSSESNTGHGNIRSLADRGGSNGLSTQTKTCLWHSFPGVSGTKVRVTLKLDWTLNAEVQAYVYNSDTGATAEYDSRIEYSLDNGSTWTVRGGANGSVSIPRGVGEADDIDIINTSGSESIDLPNPGSIDITQIRVRDRVVARVNIVGAGNGSGYSDVTASVSTIRLEIETANCIASVSADRWKGEYFNNQNLSLSPTMVRDDSTPSTDFLNLNFGSGSPHPHCATAVDNFSARWTRTVSFAAGTYRFTTTVDNGVRLYIDGQLQIDQWANLPPNTYTADVALSAAPHQIKMEFVEYNGGASVSLSWADVTNCVAIVPAGRWKGEYYNNTTLAGSSAMVRDDGADVLNFNFGDGGPGGNCGLDVDNFSARWTRTANFAASTYRFSVTGDDGVRLYVDGNLKINKWFSQGATTYTADVTFSSAGSHQVKLEYFEGGGPAIALLSWADATGVNCLPNMPLPLISSASQTGGKENIASTSPSQAPKRCGQKNSD
jgi:single-stranded DNA-binding protein